MIKNTPTGKAIYLFSLFLSTTILLAISQHAYAHKVERYTVSCFQQGETVTIHATVSSTGYNSYAHWQYRTTAGSAWAYLSNGNNTINGRSFNVTGASQPTFIENSIDDLVIANLGSPAYSNQLDNVEFRVLMTDFGLDPETHPWPAIPVYGAEEFGDKDAKYIRIRARQGGENCYSSCANNMLVLNPAAVPPPITDYFGGFEVPGAGNFSAPAANDITARAYTDMTQWTSGTPGANARYRIINNPDSMNTAFSAFAPHSGMNMMLVNANNSCSNRVWYRTITLANPNQFYQGTLIFRAWFSKLSSTHADPALMLELKGGATASTPAASYVSLGSVTQTISGTPGAWVQLSLTVNIPANLYKKLEVSIKTPNACGGTAAYVAIDDLCLLEPAGGLLPVVMTALKTSYTNGVAHLQWSSLQEQNSNYFDIQRSNDGASYNHLYTLPAKGSSDTEVKYVFDDIKPEAGVNYYRLKLVDRDGQYQYSNIATVNAGSKGTAITGVYPAPFIDKLTIAISSESKTTAQVSLFDNTGKQLSSRQLSVTKGINNLEVDNLGKLPRGFYILKVQTGNEVYVKKLIK